MADSDGGDSKVGLIRGRSLSNIFRAVFPSHDVSIKNSSEILSTAPVNNENPFLSQEHPHTTTSSSNNPILKTQSLTSLYNMFHFGYGSHSVLSDSQTSLSRTQSIEEVDVDTSSASSSKPIQITANNRSLFVPKMETIPGSPNMGDGFLLSNPQKQEHKKTSLLERLVRTEKFTLNNQEINAFAPTSQ